MTTFASSSAGHFLPNFVQSSGHKWAGLDVSCRLVSLLPDHLYPFLFDNFRYRAYGYDAMCFSRHTWARRHVHLDAEAVSTSIKQWWLRATVEAQGRPTNHIDWHKLHCDLPGRRWLHNRSVYHSIKELNLRKEFDKQTNGYQHLRAYFPILSLLIEKTESNLSKNKTNLLTHRCSSSRRCGVLA